MKRARLSTFLKGALSRLLPRERPGKLETDALRRQIELVMCTVADGLHIVDRHGNMIEANDAFGAMLGYTHDELMTLHVADWDANWNPALLQSRLAASREQHVVFETEYRRKDGSVLTVELHVAAASFDGRDYLCAATRDISERKRIEQELRIAATAFEAQEGMVITDADKIILRVNRAFTESSGYTTVDVVGKPLHRLRSGRHQAEFYDDIWRVVGRDGYWRGEMVSRRKNGDIYTIWGTMTAVKGADGKIGNYVATETDITRRKAADEEIRELAFYDSLTKLGNRRLLLDRLQLALTAANRSGSRGALLFIDLDNFKNLNDTAGHDIGDLLLRQVARRLTACVREGDTVARLGGDEFVVLLATLPDAPEQAAQLTELIGERILAALNMPYELAAQQHYSSPSIGAALFGAGLDTVAELLRRADLAMYQAKAGGRNALRFFDPAMQAAISRRAEMEAALRLSLQLKQFVLHYQPQVSSDGRLMGAEALVRWCHPRRGLVGPGEFIPLAEETGLIIALGNWVLEEACVQLIDWAERRELDGISLSVNVSARQFRQRDFVEQVLGIVSRTGADPRRLKLELTESLLVDNLEDTISKMTALKACGIGFSLDDFGVGYSSLSYLKRLPLSQLKIDQSFVRDVLTDASDAAIAQTIIALGKILGLTVIAEGVETEAQRAFFKQHGCHAYQGYLFGRPQPVEQFEQTVRGFEPAPSKNIIRLDMQKPRTSNGCSPHAEYP